MNYGVVRLSTPLVAFRDSPGKQFISAHEKRGLHRLVKSDSEEPSEADYTMWEMGERGKRLNE